MTKISFIETDGTHTWFGAARYAQSLGCRLPTARELRHEIEKHGNRPLFEFDVWVPAIDEIQMWISVGNYDPHARLGRSHTELFGIPGWSDNPNPHEWRRRIAVVSGAAVFVPSDSTLTWSASKALAEAQGGQLPSRDEVRSAIAANAWQPLFPKDVWIAIRDGPNEWISAGNMEPHVRLGRTHSEMWGAPHWSETPGVHDFRGYFGVTFHTRVAVIRTNGDLTYTAAKNLAAAYGARLPTQAEIQELIEQRQGPVVHEDAWMPIMDSPNSWVSAGNYDPSVRLGKTHAQLWASAPGWGENPQPQPFKAHLGLVFTHKRHAQTPVVFSRTDGRQSWDHAVQLAVQQGGRLASVAEVRQALMLNGNRPLFNEDVWVPVIDGHNLWVSVGNYDPNARLGKTHTELFGAPAWGNDNNFYAHRQHIGFVFGKTVFASHHGNQRWSSVAEYVRHAGAVLPSAADVKGALYAHGFRPMFHEDVWIAVSDAPNTWVSAGNYDPNVRLGKTHTELFGAPAWGETDQPHPWRRTVGFQFFN